MADKENEDPQTNDEIIDPMTQQRKFPDTERNDAQLDKDAEPDTKRSRTSKPSRNNPKEKISK